MRFRRSSLLIVGCGDVGLRVLRALPMKQTLLPRIRVLAVTSQSSRVVELRQQGAVPLLANLDAPDSLRRLAGLADRVLHLAPPPADGTRDARTRALALSLRLRTVPLAMVYASTTGVYGDCAGEWVDESRPVNPMTARARRRVAAEAHVRHLGRSSAVRTSILRIPGIYASDRPNGTPVARLKKGTPVLRAEDDVFTNHIHADDLAHVCLAALWRGRAQRVFNVNDNSQMTMGDYFDAAADHHGLPRPPRVSRSEASTLLPPSMLSFMNESRRLSNARMKKELRFKLRHPRVVFGE
ncbi:MAG: hypothetical protein RLZZ126_95 [Pseudomonadota bacterium]